MELDRKRLIDNIYRYAKEKDIKIGTLEQNAGVSPGYLSRLAKDESKGSFGVDLLCSAAEQLGRTLDDLVYTNNDVLSPNELKMIAFLDKLTLKTESFQLEWQMLPPMIEDPTYIFEHPLFRLVDREELNMYGDWEICKESEYCSRFLEHGNAQIAGNCFHVPFDTYGGREVYIMSAKERNSSNDKEILEVYFIQRNGTIEPIASTKFVNDQIQEAMKRLYLTIEAARSHLTLDKGSLGAMDRFLNE